MTYNERRRLRRAEVKAALLIALREYEARNERVNLADLALRLGRSVASLRILWHELAREQLIEYPAKVRQVGEYRAVATPRDLAERIAAVREAKAQKWERTGRKILTEAELDEVLA
jgi:ABC-type arginine transport system ATPase subunit